VLQANLACNVPLMAAVVIVVIVVVAVGALLPGVAVV